MTKAAARKGEAKNKAPVAWAAEGRALEPGCNIYFGGQSRFGKNRTETGWLRALAMLCGPQNVGVGAGSEGRRGAGAQGRRGACASH